MSHGAVISQDGMMSHRELRGARSEGEAMREDPAG